jgi:hypothetical protein
MTSPVGLTRFPTRMVRLYLGMTTVMDMGELTFEETYCLLPV